MFISLHNIIINYICTQIILCIYSLALCVVLNVTYHNDLCNTIADEEESVDLLVDVLQMFRDIGPVFCLAAEALCRLIESHKQLKDEVSYKFKYSISNFTFVLSAHIFYLIR